VLILSINWVFFSRNLGIKVCFDSASYFLSGFEFLFSYLKLGFGLIAVYSWRSGAEVGA